MMPVHHTRGSITSRLSTLLITQSRIYSRHLAVCTLIRPACTRTFRGECNQHKHECRGCSTWAEHNRQRHRAPVVGPARRHTGTQYSARFRHDDVVMCLTALLRKQTIFKEFLYFEINTKLARFFSLFFMPLVTPELETRLQLARAELPYVLSCLRVQRREASSCKGRGRNSKMSSFHFAAWWCRQAALLLVSHAGSAWTQGSTPLPQARPHRPTHMPSTLQLDASVSEANRSTVSGFESQSSEGQYNTNASSSCREDQYLVGSVCTTCANVRCPPGQQRTGLCSHSSKGFVCAPGQKFACPAYINGTKQYRHGTELGTCRPCTHQVCTHGTYRTGQCAGTTNGFQCVDCANTVCPTGKFRQGSCTSSSKGYTCVGALETRGTFSTATATATATRLVQPVAGSTSGVTTRAVQESSPLTGRATPTYSPRTWMTTFSLLPLDDSTPSSALAPPTARRTGSTGSSEGATTSRVGEGNASVPTTSRVGEGNASPGTDTAPEATTTTTTTTGAESGTNESHAATVAIVVVVVALLLIALAAGTVYAVGRWRHKHRAGYDLDTVPAKYEGAGQLTTSQRIALVMKDQMKGQAQAHANPAYDTQRQDVEDSGQDRGQGEFQARYQTQHYDPQRPQLHAGSQLYAGSRNPAHSNPDSTAQTGYLDVVATPTKTSSMHARPISFGLDNDTAMYPPMVDMVVNDMVMYPPIIDLAEVGGHPMHSLQKTESVQTLTSSQPPDQASDHDYDYNHDDDAGSQGYAHARRLTVVKSRTKADQALPASPRISPRGNVGVIYTQPKHKYMGTVQL